MVHRRGVRFGVPTSGTLRKAKYFLTKDKYHTGQYVLSKYVERSWGQQFTVDQKFQQIVPDGNLQVGGNSVNYDSTPAYSLNKRKRWLLPKLLKDAILEDEGVDELPFKLSVVERAPMQTHIPQGVHGPLHTNIADCLSVTRSHSKKGTVRTPKKRPYAFEMDLRADRWRNRYVVQYRRDDSEGEEEEEESETKDLPELVYEICYPRPFKAHPRCIQQQTDRISRSYFDRFYYYNLRNNKQDPQKNNGSVRTNIFVHEEDCDLESEFEDQCDWNLPCDTDHNEVERSRMAACLGDFVRPHPRSRSPREKRRKRNRSRRGPRESDPQHTDYKARCCYWTSKSDDFDENSVNLCKKEYPEDRGECRENGNFVDGNSKAVPDESSELHSPSVDSGYSDTDDAIFTFDPTKHEVPWQEVRFERTSLMEVNLARTFGERLIDFAASDPFCVAIDLRRFDEGDVTPSSSDEVILLIQKVLEEDDAALCRFRVCDLRDVKDRQTPVTLSLATFDAMQVYNVSDVVRLINESITSAMRSTKKDRPRKRKDVVHLETVSHTLGWKYRSKAQQEVVRDIKQEHEVSAARPFVTHRPCAALTLDYCEICCDDITDTEGSRTSAVALSECSHWFCGACWQQYVTSRTLEGDVNIKCPAIDCNIPVDRITLLSLLPDALLPLYTRLQQQQLLGQQKTWEWCQNPHCSKLVAAVEGARHGHSGDDQMNVIHCDCGYSWCRGCREGVHWPATCQQATEYQEYIEKKGIDAGLDLITEVEVKRCPECDYPLEKNGGCSHMQCRFCQHEYCWECLSDWKTHDWDACAIRPMESISLSGRKRMSVVAYLRAAAERRKERIKIGDVASAALSRGMYIFFRHLKTKSRDLPLPQPLTLTELHEPYMTTWIGSHKDREDFVQLIRLVQDAVSIYSEINFILEYLNVLIATSKTRELRLRRSGWRDMMDRLSFIAIRVHSVLTGESMVKYSEYSESLQRLVTTGRKRLRDVVKAVPRVHRLLQKQTGMGKVS